MEAILDKKLTGALMGFKADTKTAKDVTDLIKQMRTVNSAMADDWNAKLLKAINAKKK